MKDMDLRVEAMTVQSQAVGKLREALLKGVFAPGERLGEVSLCAQLGVSRSSVREALRSLEAEKLISIIPNKGAFVAKISLSEAEDIYHVRAMLEGEACFLFARRAEPGDLEAMREALDAFHQADKQGDVLRRVASTARFYDVILDGCGNKVIAEILRGLHSRISWLRARSMSVAGRTRGSRAEMAQILDAIEARDARSARAAAVAHVTAARDAARVVFEDGAQAQALGGS